MKGNKSPHPGWALAHRTKGTELRCFGGKYYLYEVSSKWNPEKKRAVKITGKLLGKITEEDGFVESDKARLRRQQLKVERVQVKEHGITSAINALCKDSIAMLQRHFPKEWQRIASMAYCRLVHQSPLKNMSHHYSCSYLSEQYRGIDLSGRSLSRFLRELGEDRSRIVDFCREFRTAKDCILFDGTDIFSQSELMDIPKLGKSKRGTFDNVVNLMCVFSVKSQQPVYYRLLPGSIKDAKAFRLSLMESGVEDAVIVMDKGFASQKNIKALEKDGLKFAIAIPRNSTLIDYGKMKSGGKSCFDGYFKHEERFIWHYSYQTEAKRRITVFFDEELYVREQKDCLNRVESSALNHSIDKFHDRQHRFGTIAIIDNVGKPPCDVFTDYKSRCNVEVMIDSLKNIVDADRTYMRSEAALEGWMFINLIALKWYYVILNLLRAHDLNKKYAPADLLKFLQEVKKVRINSQWHDAEITADTQEMIKKLGFKHIT